MSPAVLSAVPPSAALRSFAAQWRARQSNALAPQSDALAPQSDALSPQSDALSPLREEAMQRFLKLGLPTRQDETWRYTDLRALAAQSFVDAPQRPGGDPARAASLSLVGKTDAAAPLLMVNGYPTLPAADRPISGIEITSLRELARLDPDRLARFLQPSSDADQQRWGLLNTALFVDGLHLRITAHVPVPVVILHVAAGDGAGNIAYPRVIIEALPGTSATIIEHHVAQGDHTPLVDSHAQITLQRDAQLEHYRVYSTGADATHVDALDIRQDLGSRCRQFTIVLGGGLVRTSLEARLGGPGASLDSHSLLVGHEERHVDCVNIVTHGAPDTRSTQTARAIAGDSSRVIFNSKVIVDAGAVHAQSQQSCRGLLLSPDAEIDTRPQLEIHADEVKCAHGATIGRLDPDMLFYMLSRGLDRDAAQSLLVFAFLADVLTGMSVAPARSAIENALIAQLPDSQTLRKFR